MSIQGQLDLIAMGEVPDEVVEYMSDYSGFIFAEITGHPDGKGIQDDGTLDLKEILKDALVEKMKFVCVQIAKHHSKSKMCNLAELLDNAIMVCAPLPF